MSSQTLRQPQVYRPGPWTRFVEGLRYGGGVGQWSWVLHRVTGLGVLLYLVVHIFDTFFVVFSPALYDHTIGLYGGWTSTGYYWPLRYAFRFGELGLIACVLFHTINGLRIILFDFWPRAAQLQKPIFWVAFVAFWAIMLPVTWLVVRPLAESPPPRTPSQGPPGVAAHP